MSTSPYKQAICLSTTAPKVEEVVVTPQELTISAGIPVQLNATVKTVGFANKAVTWSVVKGAGVTVDLTGKVMIPADFVTTGEEPDVVIQATSVFDKDVFGTAEITVL